MLWTIVMKKVWNLFGFKDLIWLKYKMWVPYKWSILEEKSGTISIDHEAQEVWSTITELLRAQALD